MPAAATTENETLIAAVTAEAAREGCVDPEIAHRLIDLDGLTVEDIPARVADLALDRPAYFGRPAQTFVPTRRPRPETPEAARFRLALSSRSGNRYSF